MRWTHLYKFPTLFPSSCLSLTLTSQAPLTFSWLFLFLTTSFGIKFRSTGIVSGSCTGYADGDCSINLFRKATKAAPLTATADLSLAKISLSLLNFANSWVLRASSLAIRSCSHFYNTSIKFFCNASCFSITYLINPWKNLVSLLFFLGLHWKKCWNWY